MADNRRPENMERITTPELARAFIDEQLAALRAVAGKWEDDRSAEEIIAEIEGARTPGREVDFDLA